MNLSSRSFPSLTRDFTAIRSRRARRSFSPGGTSEVVLEARLLTVPVFFLNPDLASGVAQAWTNINIPDATDSGAPTEADQSGTGVDGGGAASTSHLSNIVVYDEYQSSGTGLWVVTGEASVTEDASASSTVELPVGTPGSGSGPVSVNILGGMTNTDQVQTDANGPYAIDVAPTTTGEGAQSGVGSSGPINLLIRNADGTSTTGTVTVTFTSTMTTSDPRFVQVGTIAIASPYVNIATNSTNNAVAVTDPGTGTVLAGGNLSSFSYTATFPITDANVAINYASALETGPNSTFGGVPGAPTAEHATNIGSFDWSFSLTVSA